MLGKVEASKSRKKGSECHLGKYPRVRLDDDRCTVTAICINAVVLLSITKSSGQQFEISIALSWYSPAPA